MISKFLVGRKTSEVVENADESGFGEGHRKAALDIRLVMPDAPRPAYSKIEAVADKVAEFYKQSQHLRGAQVVFSDLGVPVRRSNR